MPTAATVSTTTESRTNEPAASGASEPKKLQLTGQASVDSLPEPGATAADSSVRPAALQSPSPDSNSEKTDDWLPADVPLPGGDGQQFRDPAADQVVPDGSDASLAAESLVPITPSAPGAPAVAEPGSGSSGDVDSRQRPARALDPRRAQADWVALDLERVVASVVTAYPALEVAMREADVAAGRQTQAWGEFDLKIKADSMSGPMGYYKTYRNNVRLEQPLFQGGLVYGQYRIGDGNFPVWYGERETNEGGEFRVGFLAPLLRERVTDLRRTEVIKTTLMRRQVDPAVRTLMLQFVNDASDAYWSWVAAGLNYDVQYEMLRVTRDRNRVYEERVKVQDLAPIELVQNERLIASREAKVVEAERKLQQAAIKLSLYLRDAYGQPVIPSPALLPDSFPKASLYTREDLDDQIRRALANRPELAELELMRQQATADLAYGQNQLLPAVNAGLDAAQDMGAAASSKGDKSPFELEAGLFFDAPAQRRKARGKIRESQGKLAQIAAKREMTENKIVSQVQDALSALITNYERAVQAHVGLQLARKLEAAERQRFDAEDSDLLRVAIQETAAIEAAVVEIEALADFFKAEAAFRAALGEDPTANLDLTELDESLERERRRKDADADQADGGSSSSEPAQPAEPLPAPVPQAELAPSP
ncbi:MAG: TolC family protein [Pirellulales bacterium]